MNTDKGSSRRKEAKEKEGRRLEKRIRKGRYE